MDMFKKIEFRFTDDNSVGLYSSEVKDIFHSQTGAFKEAYDKFYLPTLVLLKENISEINLLDICYGIGYNTKTFLNKTKNLSIHVDALEHDKEFVLLSPLIKDNIKNDLLKIKILLQIIKNSEDILAYKSLISNLENSDYIQFLSPHIIEFIKKLINIHYKNISSSEINQFLHNIYYNYISNDNICEHEINNNKEFKINYHYGDARKTINNTNNLYDIVFLDAFSSQKDPTLWTIDFLSLIKNKMKDNSILISYSKSTPFRSALIELGFFVGKTFIDNSDMGTIASKNKNLILNPLSDFDYQLINTRSGITYKDPLLSFDSSTILLNRNLESKTSNRISRTQFLKLLSK